MVVLGLVALSGAKKLLGDRAHGLEMFPGIHDVLKVLESVRDAVVLEVGLESLLVLVPFHDHGLLYGLDGGGGIRNLGGSGRVLPAARTMVRGILALSLSTLGRVRACGLCRRRRSGHVERASIVIVYASHVVLQVPLARESVAG